jgi:hypothetical protein
VRFRRDNCLRRGIMIGCGHATVSTELWSQVLSMDGGEVGVFFILQIHRNLFWLVGTMFGWLIPPVVFIAIRTLPEGFSCWREFWRFYELESQTSLQLIVPIYALLALIGMVSTVVLLTG